ncbi:MAG: zinc ribbon domain-containing protein, partial [Alphaproteobacteria bacterium]|nr:zinc ribbon domain-containing protein [Alphaproteobacteria bacterium]
PLVTRQLWERVQAVLESRHTKKTRRAKREFAFSGLIICGHCGCALVGEIKKGRYVYYHCTGYRGKCNEPYVREEVIEKEFSDVLRQMRFDEDVVPSMIRALRESHADELREHEEAISRLQAEQDRLSKRIHAMYIDKLDGKVEPAFFDRMSREWQAQLDRCADEIQRRQSADRTYLDEGVQLLELSQAAPRLFNKNPPHEKRRLLNFLLSNSVWKEGKLSATFRQPFDLIAETAALAAATAGTGDSESGEHPVWLGD